jgi:hypothetical protein
MTDPERYEAGAAKVTILSIDIGFPHYKLAPKSAINAASLRE